MATGNELIAHYNYFDRLDFPGRAWEFLRRRDDYRADYRHLQTLKRPEPFECVHSALSNKWHIRRLLSPDSRTVPEFFHESWDDITLESIIQESEYVMELMADKKPPKLNTRTWKHSIICKDLKDQGLSRNNTAKRLYPDYPGDSHYARHQPGRQRVRDDLKRLEKLQAAYLKIAYTGKGYENVIPKNFKL